MFLGENGEVKDVEKEKKKRLTGEAKAQNVNVQREDRRSL